MDAVRRIRFAALAVLWLALSAGAARAEIIVDPRPPMRWAELLDCELVVTAKYKAHQPGQISLEVVNVLRGKGVRAGDVVAVKLEHWYSVETGPVGFESRRPDGKPDGLPRLCYKVQLINPGDAVPVQLVKDVRRPVLYFLPNAAAPALTRRGQVESAFFADGWRQALDKRPIDLLFRLAQRVDPALARDALEELYATRGPHALDELVAWVLNPPPDRDIERGAEAGDLLLAVGDRKGDVYDRAHKLLAAEAKGSNPYARFVLGRLLATTDRARAAVDFAAFLRGKSPGLRETTAYCVGYLGNEAGLDLALGLLKDPALAEAAVSALRTLLERNYRGHQRPAEWARVRAQARPRLRAAIAAPDLPEAVETQLRQNFRDLVDDPPALDLARAEKAVLDPTEQCYAGIVDGEGHRTYEAARRAFDVRLVPLLVRVLREVPAARGQQAYRFREALLHYAAVCPNALKAELDRLRVDLKDFREAPHELSVGLAVRLRSPQTADQLVEVSRQRAGRAWLRRKQVPADALRELQHRIDQGLQADSGSYPWDLDVLLRIDRAAGRQVLDRGLARRDRLEPDRRADLLAIAVGDGRAEYLDELLRLAPPDRLLADDDNALALYLKALDGARALAGSRFGNELHLDYRYTGMLRGLFPSAAPAFFARIEALLESPLLPERAAAVELLEGTLHWDLGFRAEAFAAPRAAKLAQVRPLLKRLAGLTEAGMRAAVLRELGVTLDGRPGPAWVPALTKAGASEDPAVAANALLLVEDQADTPGCYDFRSLPPPERERVVQARLRDERDGRPKAAPLTRRALEGLWADLGGSLTRAYPAAAALLAAPQDSLPFLKQVLRPVPHADAAHVRRLIADLGAKAFAVREKAMRELHQLGEQPVPFLREALKAADSLEVRRRVQVLLDGLEGWSGERPRVLRAVDLLESLGTPEARDQLRALAGGVPGAFVTREAQAALRRLDWRLPG